MVKKMIKIEYKTPNDKNWSVLSIPEKNFKNMTDDESVSIEIREHLYAKLDRTGMSAEELDVIIESIEYKLGNYWNNIVIPILEKTYKGMEKEEVEVEYPVFFL